MHRASYDCLMTLKLLRKFDELVGSKKVDGEITIVRETAVKPFEMTAKKKEMLKKFYDGESLQQIASDMGVTLGTVQKNFAEMASAGLVDFAELIDPKIEELICSIAATIPNWNGRMRPIKDALDAISFFEIGLTLRDPQCKGFLDMYRSEVYIPDLG